MFGLDVFTLMVNAKMNQACLFAINSKTTKMFFC